MYANIGAVVMATGSAYRGGSLSLQTGAGGREAPRWGPLGGIPNSGRGKPLPSLGIPPRGPPPRISAYYRDLLRGEVHPR